MLQRFQTRQWVPFPVELVFAFFANPHNLPPLMPPKLNTRVEDVRMAPPPPRPIAADPTRRFLSIAAGPGTEILISFRPVSLFPGRVSWTAKIVEFEWNSHMVDEQIRGPFASFRHRHGTQAELRDGVEGTLASDDVEFELAGGMFGSLAGGVVRGQLAKQFAYRQKRLPEILAAASRQASRRA